MNMRTSIFDALAQWCLVFGQPLSMMALNEATSCTLYGVLVRQKLNVFLGEATFDQSVREEASSFHEDFSMVNDGIPCTLGELQSGRVEARLILEFATENQKNRHSKVLRYSSWKDLARSALIPWLVTVQKQIRGKKRGDSHILCLDGLMQKSGYLGERSLKYKAALAAARGVALSEIPSSHVHRAVVREVVDKKEYVRHGSTATVALYNGRGEIVGNRTMIVDQIQSPALHRPVSPSSHCTFSPRYPR